MGGLFSLSMNMKYLNKLAKRFISDYKLPIPIIEEKTFLYYLVLFDKDFGSLSKYNKLTKLINERFSGDPYKFLEYYNETKDNIIHTIQDNEAYKRFNSCDMSVYATSRPNNVGENLYIQPNIGKRFISIDLIKANLQALNFVDKDILLQTNSYEDFIKKFTDIYYMAESKNIRNIIFGNLNPKRTITVEKYIINKIRGAISIPGNLVVINNDELIYEVPLDCDITSIDVPNFNVRVDNFILEGYELKTDKPDTSSRVFYKKSSGPKLIALPQQFYPICYKLLNNLTLIDADLRITYEGYSAILDEEFHVLPIKS